MQSGGFPPQGGGFPPQPGWGQPGQQPGWGQPQQPGGWGPQPLGAPSPHGAPYQPPPPKSKMGCIIGGVVVALGVLALVGGIVAVALTATAPARDAGHAFLKQLRQSDYDAAWQSSSKDLRGHVTASELGEKMEQSFPEAGKSTDATFNSTSIQNSRACLGGSLDTPSGQTPIYMRLLKEDGAWKVDAIAKRPVDGCDGD